MARDIIRYRVESEELKKELDEYSVKLGYRNAGEISRKLLFDYIRRRPPKNASGCIQKLLE